MDGRFVQSPSLRGEEARGRVRPGAEPVAQPGAPAKGFGRGGVGRHFALLLLLGAADMQRAIVQIDIAAVQPERLTEPQAGGRHQPDQRPHRRRVQRRRQRPRDRHQRDDLCVGVDVWRHPLLDGGQQIVGGHLEAATACTAPSASNTQRQHAPPRTAPPVPASARQRPGARAQATAESVKLPDPVVDRPRRITPSRQPRPVPRVKRRQRPRHPRNNRRSAHQQPPIQSRETKTRSSIGRRRNYPK